MNKEEIDIWLKYFANRPVGYQMYDENEVKRKFNLFDIFQYIKLLQQKVNQLETNRDEAIEELAYMSTDAYVEDYDIREKHYNLLLSILERGKE